MLSSITFFGENKNRNHSDYGSKFMNIIHYQSMIYFHFYWSFSQNILYMTIVKNIIVACFLMKIERTNYHHMFLLLTVKKKFGILSITWWGRICTIKDYVHVGFILLVKYFYRPPPPALLRKNQPILIVIVKNNSYNVRIIYANLWKNASKLKTKPHQNNPIFHCSTWHCI